MKKKQEKYIDIKYQELLIQWQQNQQRMHLYFIVLIQWMCYINNGTTKKQHLLKNIKSMVIFVLIMIIHFVQSLVVLIMQKSWQSLMRQRVSVQRKWSCSFDQQGKYCSCYVIVMQKYLVQICATEVRERIGWSCCLLFVVCCCLLLFVVVVVCFCFRPWPLCFGFFFFFRRLAAAAATPLSHISSTCHAHYFRWDY